MKNCLFTTALALAFVFNLFGQPPVTDDEIVPVGISLNRELRFQIASGGNIEFVFSSIDQYETGIENPSAGPPAGATANFYETEFTIVATTDWDLFYGTTDPALEGTFNPGNSLARRHVGWRARDPGNHDCGTELDCSTNGAWINQGATPKALDQYPTLHTANGSGNAGDANDNQIVINWEVGTTPGGGSDMENTDNLLEANIPSDRYVTNILFDLRPD